MAKRAYKYMFRGKTFIGVTEIRKELKLSREEFNTVIGKGEFNGEKVTIVGLATKEELSEAKSVNESNKTHRRKVSKTEKSALNTEESTVKKEWTTPEIVEIVEEKAETSKKLEKEKPKELKIFYSNETYGSVEAFGRAFGLSPNAISKLKPLSESQLTKEVLRDAIEKDRKLWRSKKLFINGMHVGTIGEYVDSGKEYYVDLMRELFKYTKPLGQRVVTVVWLASVSSR